MKKALISLLAASLVGCAAAPIKTITPAADIPTEGDHMVVVATDDAAVMMLDLNPATVKHPSDGVASVLMFMLLIGPDSKPTGAVAIRTAFDCKNNTWQALSFTTLNVHGQALKTGLGDENPETPPSGSAAEAAFKIVCGRSSNATEL